MASSLRIDTTFCCGERWERQESNEGGIEEERGEEDDERREEKGRKESEGKGSCTERHGRGKGGGRAEREKKRTKYLCFFASVFMTESMCWHPGKLEEKEKNRTEKKNPKRARKQKR